MDLFEDGFVLVWLGTDVGEPNCGGKKGAGYGQVWVILRLVGSTNF